MKKILFFALALIESLYSVTMNDSYMLAKQINVRSWIEFKNQNLTRQKKDYSCGSASLSTILKYYYNVNISEDKILNYVMKKKKLTGKSSLDAFEAAGGLSFLDLSSFAKEINFRGVGLSVDIQTLEKLQIPVIVFLNTHNGGHFSVLKKIKNGLVYLADPSFGNIKIKISRFRHMFIVNKSEKMGKILAIIPQTKRKSNKNFMKVEKQNTSIYRVIGVSSSLF